MRRKQDPRADWETLGMWPAVPEAPKGKAVQDCTTCGGRTSSPAGCAPCAQNKRGRQ
jgi:hypothetical protein